MNSASLLLHLLVGLLLFGTACSEPNEPRCDPPPAVTASSGPAYSFSVVPDCGAPTTTEP